MWIHKNPLMFVMLTAILGFGCIKSKTPATDEVAMTLGEQLNFSVVVNPSWAKYEWTLDGETLENTGKSYVYTAEAGEHTLRVNATHIFGVDTRTWTINVSSPPTAVIKAEQTVYTNAAMVIVSFIMTSDLFLLMQYCSAGCSWWISCTCRSIADAVDIVRT